MKTEMVHEIIPIQGDLADLLQKTMKSNQAHAGIVKVDGFVMREGYKKFADTIENFEVRDDDIWVCSFPKTGTTWTQEMVWCIANDLDFERAKVPLPDRFPFFDLSPQVDLTGAMQHNPDLKLPEHLIDSVSFVENLPSPRFIKTHLPFNLLPRQLRTGEKKPKIVYVARNAKDTCISYFHHTKLFEGFNGDLEDFCTLFIGDTVVWGPFWKHVLGYWKKKIEENLLFIKYEDMKRDLPWVIKKTATFLGKNLTTDQVSTLNEHLSFARMKANPAVNNDDLVATARQVTNSEEEGAFMRSGNVDQWKTDMTPERIEQFNNWTRENLKGTRLYF